jgi:hypothetical protein
VVPSHGWGWGLPELGRSGDGFGRGMGGEGRGAHHGPICGRGRAEGRRWRPGGLAAKRLGSGYSGLGAGRGGAGKVHGVLSSSEVLWMAWNLRRKRLRPRRRLTLGEQAAPACAGRQRPK